MTLHGMIARWTRLSIYVGHTFRVIIREIRDIERVRFFCVPQHSSARYLVILVS